MVPSVAKPIRALLASTVLLVGIQAAAAEAAAGGSSLGPNSTLVGSSRQALQSANSEYQLVMQADGNLVLYGPGRALWWTNTGGGTDRTLVMQSDGNLVVYGGGGALWNTHTEGNPGTTLSLQNDGNLVLYAPGSRAIWSTGTTATGLPPNSSLVGSSSQYLQSPNRQYQLVMQTDGNLVVYGPGGAQWWTNTVGGSDRTLVMQNDGNLVVYGAGRALWYTSTAGQPGTSLTLQDDGNLVLYASTGRAIWSWKTGRINAGGVIGDDYPANLKAAATSWNNSVNDGRGFYVRNCTSFVAWRLAQVNGVNNFSNTMMGPNGRTGKFGNANTWDDNARAIGFTVDRNPAVGAVAQTDAGGFGHVAWVSQVNGDGSITIEQYNANYDSSWSSARVAAANYMYLHIKDQ